jgi:hypothetical protein
MGNEARKTGARQMTTYQQTLAELAPEMDALHMETLAYMVGSTLDGMPMAFFEEIAAHARKIGPARLAEIVAPA